MSYLEKLLEGVDLEWKRLEDVTIFSNGKGHEKAITNDGQFIVVNSKFISTGGKVVKYTNQQICPLIVDDVLIVMSDLPNGKALAKTFLIDENEKYTLNQRIGSITIKNKSTLLPTFFNYYLNRTPQLLKFNNGIDQTNLRKKQILDVKIPIPSLSVQKEIVRILDIFTELNAKLNAELNAELTARKQQYKYYREQLLSFEKGEVEWKSLRKVLLTTNNIRWRDNDNTYRYIDLSSVSRDNNSIIETSEINSKNAPSRAQKIVLKNDVIFATTRPTQQRLCLIDQEHSGQIASTGYCVLRAKEENILPKWIFYHLTSNSFKNYVEENQNGSAYPAISDAKVKEYEIPIPPLEEQKRIIAILDKFDTLTNYISEGFPEEIELRKKQYEHYRDMLLTFPQQEAHEYL